MESIKNAEYTEEEFIQELDQCLEKCIRSTKISHVRICELLWNTFLSHYISLFDDRVDIDKKVENLARDARIKWLHVKSKIVRGV